MPVEGIDRKSYLAAKFGSLERAERSYDRLRIAGTEVGIEFRFDDIEFTPNTVDSHRLIQFSTSRMTDPTDIVDMLFVAYFVEARNIGDIHVLHDIAVSAGLNGDEFISYIQSDMDKTYILEQDEAIRREGINGVPCFVIDGKYAVSGAQSPEIFHQVFDLVHQERMTTTSQSAAE
tara:strand:+ start:2051 stop:2578 length:528 start_codon:yes stop_codon:yes gene_type:complete